MRRVLPVVAVAVTLVFAWLAVRDVDAADAWRAARDSDPRWLPAAVAVFLFSIWLRAVRWRLLFPPGARPPQRIVTRALLVGYFFNTILPARAGEAARVLALTRATRSSRAEAAATVIVERTFDVLALLALLFVLVPWLPDVTWLRPAAWLAAALAALLLVAIVVLARWGDRPLRRALRPFGARAEAAGGNLGVGLAALRDARVAAEALALTAISWVVLGLSFWLVMRAFDLGLSPIAGMLVLIATGVGSILPSSPAGLGVFEAATVLALHAYGISDSTALSFAVVLHVVNIVPFLAAGAIVPGMLRTRPPGRW